MIMIRVLHIECDGVKMLLDALIHNVRDFLQHAVDVFVHSLERPGLGALRVLRQLRGQNIFNECPKSFLWELDVNLRRGARAVIAVASLAMLTLSIRRAIVGCGGAVCLLPVMLLNEKRLDSGNVLPLMLKASG